MSLSLRDTARRERFLLAFSWAMQDYPKNAKVKRELRAEITANATELGMRQAVAAMGHPRVLADGYLSELDYRPPRWNTGAVWGTLSVCALIYLVAAYGWGTADTLHQLGGGTVSRVFLGATTTWTSTATEFSVSSTVTWQVVVFYVLVFAVPFALGARVWRIWTRPRVSQVPAHAAA